MLGPVLSYFTFINRVKGEGPLPAGDASAKTCSYYLRLFCSVLCFSISFVLDLAVLFAFSTL